MVIVLDPCTIGVTTEPTGGITLKISDVGGMFTGSDLLLPIQKESADQLYEAWSKMRSPLVKATPDDVERAARNANLA